MTGWKVKCWCSHCYSLCLLFDAHTLFWTWYMKTVLKCTRILQQRACVATDRVLRFLLGSPQYCRGECLKGSWVESRTSVHCGVFWRCFFIQDYCKMSFLFLVAFRLYHLPLVVPLPSENVFLSLQHTSVLVRFWCRRVWLKECREYLLAILTLNTLPFSIFKVWRLNAAATLWSTY